MNELRKIENTRRAVEEGLGIETIEGILLDDVILPMPIVHWGTLKRLSPEPKDDEI